MNRLKFRIWDNHTERYVTFVYETNKDCYLFIGRSGYVTAFNCYGEEIDFEDDRFIVQQYTGLQDHDGKDIYEGDILKYQSSNPRFTQVVVRWTKEEEDNHPGWVISDSYCQYGKPEIIGNIMQNPELIKTNE